MDAKRLMYDPKDIFYFLSFYSPIILAMTLLFVSFFFQSFKGIICLLFLLGVSIARYYFYWLRTGHVASDSNNESGENNNSDTNDICNSVEYSKYGNKTFSTFVFGFLIAYLLVPMFLNNSINYMIIQSLLVYTGMDLIIKQQKNCLPHPSEVILNFLVGFILAGVIIGSLYAGGSSYLLFFNEIQSTKEVCNMPSKQTFKCQVYKNGELIGNM
jgi:hypothetical protein